LDVGGKEGEEAGISAGDVGVGGDYAGFGDEKTGAHRVETLEADDGGFGALDDFFEGELELECSGLRGGDGGDRTREGGGDEFEIGVEVNGFDEPVFAVIVAVEINPVHRAFGEKYLAGGVARKREASGHGMFEALPKRGARAMEVAAGKIFLERGDADRDAVEFNGRTRWGAGDLESVSGRGSNEAEK